LTADNICGAEYVTKNCGEYVTKNKIFTRFTIKGVFLIAISCMWVKHNE